MQTATDNRVFHHTGVYVGETLLFIDGYLDGLMGVKLVGTVRRGFLDLVGAYRQGLIVFGLCNAVRIGSEGARWVLCAVGKEVR